jgi:hypothetical protein
MSPSNGVAQLYIQAPGSLFFAFYDSQGYGGGILTRLHKGVENFQVLKIYTNGYFAQIQKRTTFFLCDTPDQLDPASSFPGFGIPFIKIWLRLL